MIRILPSDPEVVRRCMECRWRRAVQEIHIGSGTTFDIALCQDCALDLHQVLDHFLFPEPT